MLRRVILVICDGMGDRPIPELGGLTPLEAARTPHLDALVKDGECGMMHTLGRGFVPGSDVAHLSLLGYPPKEFYCGRGPIEAAGVGLTLQEGDVAFRGNFATVNQDLTIADRRAGRIRNIDEFAAAIAGMRIDKTDVIVRPGTAHRGVLVLRGHGLSAHVSDMDPHRDDSSVQTARALDSSDEAAYTANVLNEFSARAQEILADHPLNLDRVAKRELPANYLLLRGGGHYNEVPSFAERWGLSAFLCSRRGTL